MNFTLRRKTDDDNSWISAYLEKNWSGDFIVSKGKIHHAEDVDGVVAETENHTQGLGLYDIGSDGCQIVILHSFSEGVGIGTTLIEEIIAIAKRKGCGRAWLITTNDNLPALRFYQKRGFVFAAVYPNAIAQSRKLKPGIPLLGHGGIPMRDEIEMEYLTE
jgi:ribosomal protein S18 acetylase RimI-like enzyme